MRKRRATKRDVLADPIYNSKVVTKLVNHIMKDGKKGTAQNIIYDAFDIVKEKTGEEAMVVFEKAMNNIKPALEVKSRRVGGANYQVPVEVKPDRAQALAFRWLAQYARLEMVILWLKILLMKLLMPQMELVHQLRRKKIHIRWQKLIKHLLIIVGNKR